MKCAKVLFGATTYGARGFSADMLWRLGEYQVPDPVVLVDIDGGETVLVLSALEVGRAKKEAGVSRCVVAPESTTEALAALVTDIVREHAVTHVTVPDTFPYALGAALAGQVALTAQHGSLYEARAVKTLAEVDKIEHAQRAVEHALSRAIECLRASTIRGEEIVREGVVVTSEHVRNIIDTELYTHGCLGVQTIVAGGLQATDPHCVGSGPLRAHWPIVIDIFPRSLTTHYYADQTRTYFKGEPSDAHRRMYETVLEGQRRAIRMVLPGVKPADMHQETLAFFEEQGYPTKLGDSPCGFFHSLGHGVGVDIHENPSVGKKGVTPLSEGNVITVEPGLYYAEAHGSAPAGGIRIEDMLLVTNAGVRNLTQMPKEISDVIFV